MFEWFAWLRLLAVGVLVLALYVVGNGDPTDFVTLRTGSSPEAIVAGMFALVAAFALVLSIPFGRDSILLNRLGTLLGSIVGSVAAFLAAWFWLASETVGGPGGYVYPLIGFIAFFLIVMAVPMSWTLFREWREKRMETTELSQYAEKGELRMYAEARSFLWGVGKDELIRRGVIRGAPEWLVQESKEPLIELMKERGVDRLIYGWVWFLDVSGDFFNPDSETQLFAEQNKTINPFFHD